MACFLEVFPRRFALDILCYMKPLFALSLFEIFSFLYIFTGFKYINLTSI